jgi:FkbM family methyltransferase
MSVLGTMVRTVRRRLRLSAQIEADAHEISGIMTGILDKDRLIAVDVGAANGLLPHWEMLDGIATIFQIEPRADACRELEQANKCRCRPDLYRVVETALSQSGGMATLYVSNAPTGSSLFRTDPGASPDCGDYVDQSYLYPITEHPIATETLTATMDRHGEPQLDLIKLDVQGSELPILRGIDAGRMDSLLGVELEIGLHDFYPEDVGFGSVLRFMEEHGLELFDVRVARVHRPRGSDHGYYQRRIFSVYDNAPTVSARVWEFDAVFFRRQSTLIALRDPKTLRRMVIVYCTYNFFSEAYALIEKAEAAAIFAAGEAGGLKQLVADLHRCRHFRAWHADTAQMEWLRKLRYRVAPRSAPRWCQYMYQDYPNG